MKWECKKCIIFDSFWQRWWLIPYEYTCATHALHRILRLHWKQFFRKRGKNSYPGIVVWFQTIISISFFIKGSCKCPMRSVTHYLWHFVNRANLLPATSTLFFNDRSKGTRGPQHLQRCFRNIEDVIIHNYRAQTWLLRSEREGGKVVSGWPCVVIVLIITSLLFPSLHPAYTLSRAWLYRIL